MKMLDEFIVEKQHEFSHATGELTTLLPAMELGTKVIHRNINKAGLVDVPGASGIEDVQGEAQQKLDLFANERLKTTLRIRDIVAGIASEEGDEIVVFGGCEHARYVVLMDPLDGSFNVGVNVSIGTISSIYRRITSVGTPAAEEDFLQPGNRQVVAGYVVHGSSAMLVYTTGCGVHAFTCDPSLDVFCLCRERMRFLEKGNTYSINEDNYIKFLQGVKKYVKYCQEKDKETQRSYTSRYIGSLMADFRRGLLKGGIYLHPNTASHPDGKLHLLYECNPMVFLAEQVGGKTSDGKEHILDIIPESLHQRRSLFVGNNHMAEDVENFIKAFSDA